MESNKKKSDNMIEAFENMNKEINKENKIDIEDLDFSYATGEDLINNDITEVCVVPSHFFIRNWSKFNPRK